MTRLGLYSAAAVVLLSVGIWIGWQAHSGVIARRALAEAETAATRRAEINAAEDARLTAERARIAFDLTLEDAAHADPVRYRDALPADRVRRLNQR